MKAIWSGMIQFGLVALPIRLYAATEEHPVRLHEVHLADGSRVEHRRFCKAEDREIPYEQVGRGFALADGRTVPLTEEDLARLPLPTKRTVDVLGFVPSRTSTRSVSDGRTTPVPDQAPILAGAAIRCCAMGLNSLGYTLIPVPTPASTPGCSPLHLSYRGEEAN
ncbi:Ku protein [Streptomyces sp. NPDC004059]